MNNNENKENKQTLTDTASNSKEVIIYSDGACTGNPGPGGYGTVLIFGDRRKELSGGFALTTNNRMELLGAIKGLQALNQPCKVTLYTDSRYVINGISEGWAKRWRANGWWRDASRTERTINADLWAALLDLCDPTKHHDVTFIWVKGHAGNAENERCDQLGVQAAKQANLPADPGYTQKAGNTTSTDQLSLFDAKPTQSPARPELTPNLDSVPPVIGVSSSNVKITQAGQACRKCNTPVVRKKPAAKRKPDQAYYFEYYLNCPKCGTNYMVEDAKRYV